MKIAKCNEKLRRKAQKYFPEFSWIFSGFGTMYYSILNFATKFASIFMIIQRTL